VAAVVVEVVYEGIADDLVLAGAVVACDDAGVLAQTGGLRGQAVVEEVVGEAVVLNRPVQIEVVFGAVNEGVVHDVEALDAAEDQAHAGTVEDVIFDGAVFAVGAVAVACVELHAAAGGVYDDVFGEGAVLDAADINAVVRMRFSGVADVPDAVVADLAVGKVV